MLKLLQYLFFGHVHKWKIIDEISVFIWGFSTNRPDHIKYILQCETCGNIKAKEGR